MAKNQTSAGSSGRKAEAVANSILKDPISGPPTVAVDIALTGTNWTRYKTYSDIDSAETDAKAVSLARHFPTRVTLNGAEYQVYSRSA